MSFRILYDRGQDAAFLTQNGVVKCKLNVGPIREFLLSRVTGQGIQIGANIFTRASEAAKKIARSKLLKQVKSVLQNPLVEATARTIFPPLGVAYDGVKAADTLVKAARQGNQRALGALTSIKQKAAAGDPKSAKALNVLKAVDQASQTVMARSPFDHPLEGLSGLNMPRKPFGHNIPVPWIRYPLQAYDRGYQELKNLYNRYSN